jgi:CHAT domain-containing protein
MPILQWCPTGHFTFLPIHAAGNYDAQGMECAADYFISSYTPSIGALLTHPSVPCGSAHAFKMTVVIQTEELYSTKKELENIQRHVSSDALVAFGVPGTAANVETVASHLSEASIVHFACHGKQDRLKPLNSGFKLDDGLLQISRIMKETSLDGSLAFLSVCEPETAMDDENLPDEAMRLGASLLFSGFHSVITTML